MRKITIFLVLAMLTTLYAGEMYEVTKDVALRTLPHNDDASKVVGGIAKGQQYEVVDTVFSWYKVKVIDGSDRKGQTGWVYAKFVTEDNKIGGQGCAFRSEPKKAYDTLRGTVRAGATIEIIEGKPLSHKVKVGGKEYWAYAEYLKPVPK